MTTPRPSRPAAAKPAARATARAAADAAREALLAGFRPCRRCRPLTPAGAPPDRLAPLLAALERDPARRWRDADLRALGLHPARVRRWFQRTHGMSFHDLSRARRLGAQLGAWFAGERTTFELPLHAPGTPFQERVWHALRAIPRGTTTTYGALAASLGRPRAVRAVARANGANRLAILIPCHRVLGADGRLTGYGGGLWRKRHLLEREGVQLAG